MNPDYKSEVFTAFVDIDPKASSFSWMGVCSLNQVKMLQYNIQIWLLIR